MGWGQYSCKDIGAVSIPGYTKRAYYRHQYAQIHSSMSKYDLYRLVVVIYQNKEHPEDVLTAPYIQSNNNDITPIPRHILERYVDGKDGETRLVDIDGKSYIYGIESPLRLIINVDTVSLAIGARKISVNFDQVLWQVLYPKIDSHEAAIKVVTAYDNFLSCHFDIRTNYYNKQKDAQLAHIAKLKRKIDAQYKHMDKVANKSAAALDVLSEQYGIEVDLSTDCW